jgi:hypothetical protein
MPLPPDLRHGRHLDAFLVHGLLLRLAQPQELPLQQLISAWTPALQS